jgi:hypothetical protein
MRAAAIATAAVVVAGKTGFRTQQEKKLEVSKMTKKIKRRRKREKIRERKKINK